MPLLQRTFSAICYWRIVMTMMMMASHGLAASDDVLLSSTQYCHDDNNDCADRAWHFPDVHISLVCKYDFRRADVTPNPYLFADERTSPTVQATWGPFLDALVGLVPQVGPDARRMGPTGLFWMHGGEGRPGWEIPPCDTNRTQAVLNLSYLTVVLNASTADTDLYDNGISYANVGVTFNEDNIRRAIREHVCDDWERLYVGVANPARPWTEEDWEYFYPLPEEICPRVTGDDSVWQDWWWLFMSLAVAVVVLLMVGWCAYARKGKGQQQAGSDEHTPSSNAV